MRKSGRSGPTRPPDTENLASDAGAPLKKLGAPRSPLPRVSDRRRPCRRAVNQPDRQPEAVPLRYLSCHNFRHSASVTYSPIHNWESGDRMVPLIRHSPSIH
eukprot:3353553-Pleurochrysis_carterae.AAC.1